MHFEVEQKHCVEDVAQLLSRLSARGATLGEPIEQSDQYFGHPCRDFVQTDEALRIRTVGGRSYVTYKGPKLDEQTKTRRELELPLDPRDGDGKNFSELLYALGFAPVGVVEKTRQPFQVQYAGRGVEGAYDVVVGLGAFVELELTSDEAGLEEAKRIIAELAQTLELGPSTRRSYLEMLLEQRPPGGN